MYAIMVQRTPSQLVTAADEIIDVASSMQALVAHGMGAVAPNREKCIDGIYGECEFYSPHTFNTPPLESGLFEMYEPRKYQQREVQAV